MTEPNSTYKLNELCSIDYKKPLGKQQDMRTSTYLAHNYIDDTMLGNKTHTKYKETRSYEEDPVLEQQRTTNYKINYVWKFGNPDEVRNVSLDRKIHYMKPFYECNLKFRTRPMRPLSSVSHSDYIWQPETTCIPSVTSHVPTPVSTTKLVIDRYQPGYVKYLDPSATTNNLNYCHRSPKDILNGIAANDHITFWNWKDIKFNDKKVFRTKDAVLCDKLPSKDCPKRRCEYPTQVKAVPNSGLTTETRDNYIQPNKRVIIFDDTHIKNDITFANIEPIIRKSEYKVLGSGERTQKYV